MQSLKITLKDFFENKLLYIPIIIFLTVFVYSQNTNADKSVDTVGKQVEQKSKLAGEAFSCSFLNSYDGEKQEAQRLFELGLVNGIDATRLMLRGASNDKKLDEYFKALKNNTNVNDDVLIGFFVGIMKEEAEQKTRKVIDIYAKGDFDQWKSKAKDLINEKNCELFK